MPPRTDRVEAHDEQALRPEDGLDGLPLALELRPRAREARGERVRDVVVARDHEQWAPEAAEEGCDLFVLASPAAVRDVARYRDQLGLETLDQRLQAAFEGRFLHASGVQIGDVEEPHGQRGTHAIHRVTPVARETPREAAGRPGFALAAQARIPGETQSPCHETNSLRRVARKPKWVSWPVPAHRPPLSLAFRRAGQPVRFACDPSELGQGDALSHR